MNCFKTIRVKVLVIQVYKYIQIAHIHPEKLKERDKRGRKNSV